MLLDISTWQLPEWLTAGSTLTIIANLVIIIRTWTQQKSFIKSSNVHKTSELSLLDTMVSKLTDTQNIAKQLNDLLDNVKHMVATFQEAMSNQEITSSNLASYVNECFQAANLSPEIKQKLRLKFDQIYYADNLQIIEKLQEEQAVLESELQERLNQVTLLEEQLAKEKEVRENVQPEKKPRRVL